MPNNEIMTGESTKERATDQFKSLSDGRALVSELEALAVRAQQEAGTVAAPFKPTAQALARALSAQASVANESLNQASRATSGVSDAAKEQEENAEDAKGALDRQDLGPDLGLSGPSPSGPGLITI